MTDANMDADDVALSIGEVAELLDISPGVLRTWERERLFKPDRSRGGHRQFRNAHIEKLKRIATLYFEDGLNPAGIRRELGAATKEVTIAETTDSTLGARLRQLRKERGMTLAATAEASGLSPSFISALERSNTGVSLQGLFRLAEALDTTIPTLRGENAASVEKNLVRASERQRFSSDDKSLVIEDIVSRPAGMEAQISTIAPGCHSGEAWTHRGQEFVYVFEGELIITLHDDERYVLGPGDTLYFRSRIEHRWANESSHPVRVLWVNAPLPKGDADVSEPRPFELIENDALGNEPEH